MRDLPLGAPDVLQEAVALGEAVESIVALAHGPHETRQGVDDVLALDGPAVLVDLGDGDLARAVVLGLDDSARRRALAGDVTGGNPMSVKACRLRFEGIVVGQSRLTGRRFRHGRSPCLRLV
jgi:calcineurin-like phosphoesterase